VITSFIRSNQAPYTRDGDHAAAFHAPVRPHHSDRQRACTLLPLVTQGRVIKSARTQPRLVRHRRVCSARRMCQHAISRRRTTRRRCTRERALRPYSSQ